MVVGSVCGVPFGDVHVCKGSQFLMSLEEGFNGYNEWLESRFPSISTYVMILMIPLELGL